MVVAMVTLYKWEIANAYNTYLIHLLHVQNVLFFLVVAILTSDFSETNLQKLGTETINRNTC